MTIKEKLRTSLIVLYSAFLFTGWGGTGHRIISRNAVNTLPAEMQMSSDWKDFVVLHASDADNRKRSVSDESPKHYIDIDNYPEFGKYGKISMSMDTLTSIHGRDFVTSQGLLPWAILASYDSLKASFTRNDIARAKIFAADLGHYIADGHMPLHITSNYDGQNSSQKGVHSRYETQMINSYQSQLTALSRNPEKIRNVKEYIFNTVYKNHGFKDSVLNADKYAVSAAGTVSGTAYLKVMWEKSSNFTQQLFDEASFSLASLIYTAWLEATEQTTSINSTADIFDGYVLYQNYPNPFNPSTIITYSMPSELYIRLNMYDILGRKVAVLEEGIRSAGVHKYVLNMDDYRYLHSGVYFYNLEVAGKNLNRKLVFLK